MALAAHTWFWLKKKGKWERWEGWSDRNGKTQKQEHRKKGKTEPVFLSPDIKHRESDYHQRLIGRCVYGGADARQFQSVF